MPELDEITVGTLRGLQSVPAPWALWSALMALPWLLPTHSQPWTMFHSDAAMALLMVPPALWALFSRRRSIDLPPSALAAAALAVVPVLQVFTGLIESPGDGWLAALYLLGFALAIVVGCRAQQLQPGMAIGALFASIGIAAMVSLALLLYQWAGLDHLGVLVMKTVDAGRPFANLGQPNNLATLLVWGLIALWWAHLAGQLRGPLATLAAALLLFGVAMTQSRTGALEVLLLGAAAIVFARALQSRRSAAALIGLGVWFVMAFVGWSPLNEALQLAPVATLEQRMAPGTRWLHWQLFIDALWQRPWTGWGWNQIVLAQVALLHNHPSGHEVIHYSHNLLLDLMLWNGIPMGLLVCMGLITWWVKQLRSLDSAPRTLWLTAVAAFGVHALLELPHGHALFLLPVGLMVGALHRPAMSRRPLRLAPAVIALPLLAILAVMTTVMLEYRVYEAAWLDNRLREAQIKLPQAQQPVPEARVLTNLQLLVEFGRMVPKRDMPPTQIARMRQLAQRQPAPWVLFRYARASGLNGDPEQARLTLALLCQLHPDSDCARAKAAWSELAQTDAPELQAVWPPAN